MIVREKRKRMIAVVMTFMFLVSFAISSYASDVTSSYSIDVNLSPCWRKALSGILSNCGYPKSYANNTSVDVVYNAEDVSNIIGLCLYYNGNNSYHIDNTYTSSNTFGGGAISWSSYKGQIDSGKVVNFICSSSYGGGKTHDALGVGYSDQVTGQVTMIRLFDPYDDTVKTYGYDYWKSHYWYETNYNIHVAPGGAV